MSISSALTNAFTGLSAGARLAEVASDNIANALTEGFARREAQAASRVVGGIGMGVRIVSIERQIDIGLMQDLRLSGATTGYLEPRASFARALESVYGDPSEAGSLSARLAAFEKSLLEASSRPESEARLIASLDAAAQLVAGINAASDKVAMSRQAADNAIARDVETLNVTLQSAHDLNKQIIRLKARGDNTLALEDQRQKLIGAIAEILPLREVMRDNGQVALFSTTGVTLLDGRPATFGFTPTKAIQATDSIANGVLSGLTVDGQPLSTGPNGGRLGQGRLSGQFELRDQITVQAQAQLDALAQNLIERLSGPGVDPTLAATEAGLFVDPQGPYDPLTFPGLAGRLALNPLVDPAEGGQSWRLRDGMNALAPQTLADPTLLQAMSRQLAANIAVASPALSADGSLADILASATSLVATARLGAETEISFAKAQGETLKAELLKDGVDTDQEMQNLMQIEKAYAANARVIQTVDDMLRTLLEI